MSDINKIKQHEIHPEAEHDVEISDLDQHGGEEPPHPGFSRWINTAFERRFGSGKSARRRAGIFATLALAVCALLVVALSYEGGLLRLSAGNPFSTTSTNASRPRTFLVPASLSRSNPFSCIMDAAWSPDNRSIAVLGYTNGCPASQSEKGLIEIYDVHPGKPSEHILPDIPIFHVLYGSSQGNTQVFFNSILWSPDGTRLAILFNVDAEKGHQDGLLLLDRSGGHADVILHPRVSSAPSNEYLVWDLAQRRPVHVSYVPYISGNYSINVPITASYRWEADGTLLPITTSSSTPALSGPVGNPDGGSSFTLWQYGYVSLTYQNGNSPVYLPGVYTWNTYFAAWSPDGRYVVDGLNIAARLAAPALPSMSNKALLALQAASLPVLPVRDKGMEKILRGLKVPTISSPGTVGTTVFWSPGGRTLAVNDGSNNVDIYDCATGRLLVALAVPANLTNNSGGGTMRWSPDGSRLLVSGQEVSVGVIWGPGQLPAG